MTGRAVSGASRPWPAEVTSDDEPSVREEARSFDALLREHGSALEAFLRRRLRSTEDAEDAVVQTMCQAWRARRRFRGDISTRAWLFTIARHVAIDMCRARAHRPEESAGDACEIELLPQCRESEPSPEKTVLRAVDRGEVRRTLCRLAPDQQRLVELHYFEGRGYAEVAGILGVPVSVVRGRLHRTRSLLRCKLSGAD